MEAVRAGKLSPVFFGSALTNFGVEPFLEEFLRMTTPPLSRMSDSGEIDAFSPDFSAFVFKIQANMNKAHRDRIAFMRVCSGKLAPHPVLEHVKLQRAHHADDDLLHAREGDAVRQEAAPQPAPADAGR